MGCAAEKDSLLGGKMIGVRRVEVVGWLTTFLRKVRSLWVKRRILVLGDSHAAVFYHWHFDFSFPHYIFDVCSVGGATVSGLQNPNSKTRAYAIFEKVIQQRPANLYITLLGEVDTGFVIWYRAQKYQTSVDEMLELAIRNYEKLIEKLSKLGMVIVISAPLPTIPDINPCGKVANLRREVKASRRQRTELTLLFNHRVREICDKIGAYFVDLDAESLEEDGQVKKALLNRNPCDHHYNFGAYADMLIKKLSPLLSSLR